MVLITINNKTFKTKNECIKYIQTLLKKYFIDDYEKEFIYDLLKRHPYYNDKINDAIYDNCSCISIKKYMGNNCFVVLKNNNNIDPFSYTTCLSGKINNRNDIITAFRNSIKQDIIIFRNKIFFDNFDVCCELCNTKLYDDMNTHIDHIIKFRDLLTNFCSDENLNILDIPITRTNNDIKLINYKVINTNELYINDTIILNKWIQYHKNNAILRPLCRQCNIKLH
jgi:hypothetical protein